MRTKTVAEIAESLLAQQDQGIHRQRALRRNPGGNSAAKDLTVETFFRIHRAHARFEPARPFEPWARRISTRAALDWLRSRRSNPARPIWIPPIARHFGARPRLRRGDSPESCAGLCRLPPALRVAATLSVIEEQPHKEVAAALGISVGPSGFASFAPFDC